MSKLFQLLGCAVVLALIPVVSADDKGTAATQKIDGTYSVVAGERDGKPMADADVQKCIVKITASAISGTDKDGKEFLNATYAMDETKQDAAGKTCHIIMKTSDGKAYQGMCEKTADGLKVVYQMAGGEAPTEFKTKEKQVLLVLKAAK
jgi:uncharacterized protein (TIGR03067 family)